MRINFCWIFFAALAVSLAQDGPKLEIQPTNSEIRKDLGKAGFFTCKPVQQGELISDLVWLDPQGREVPDELGGRVYSSVSASGRGRELYITDITEQDQGDYTCRARYGNQEVTASFRLSVFMSIRWVDAPPQQHPVTGTNATIKCEVRADPPAIVQWMRSSGEYVRTTDRYTPLETGLLHIVNVTSEDDGEFVCRAKVPNNGNMDERRVRVEVYSRPEITYPKPDTPVKIVESEEGAIRCQATGKPSPSLRWLGPAGSDAALVPGLSVDDEGTLRFQPASRQMAGQYRCAATNSVDSVETAVGVEVIVPPEIVSYENVTSAESESAQLVCRAAGSPLPDVSIRRAGTEGLTPDSRAETRQFPDGDVQVAELNLLNVSRSDAGPYSCQASNSGGAASHTAHLTVQFRPVLSGPPSGDVFTWSGHPAELWCRVEAEPAAEVVWTFAAQRAQGDQSWREGTSVLTVTPTEERHYGVYQCTASNARGSRSLDVVLRRADVPGAIQGAAVKVKRPTSVEFSIPPPSSDGGLEVTDFWVQFATPGQAWQEAGAAEWPAEGPFRLQRLTPEQSYRFRLAAVNSVGAGAWSTELNATLPEISVPLAPRFVSSEGVPVSEGEPGPDEGVASDQPHSYEARWQPAGDNGAPIDQYNVVFYKVVFSRNSWHEVASSRQESLVIVPEPLTYRLTGLKAESHYRLEVRARNRVGLGATARIIVRTAKGAPQEEDPAPARASGLVVGLVVAALLVLLILCDLTCYAVNNRGLTHMLCSRARGSAGGAKLSEEAASEKEPLQENGNGNKSSPAPPEANGESDAEEEPTIDKAQLDAAKDSAV